jgi:pyruvate ferredoxin oxidoreductase gamma subunit
MFQVRFHGRGGQGVVTAAELLSLAAFAQGKHAQALPSFGSERTGAPVLAYCRIDEKPIRSHDPVTAPEAVVVQDPTMLHLPGVLDDLAVDGVVLVNSSRTPSELGLGAGTDWAPLARVFTIPATDLSRESLGRPLPNTALLGALAGLTGAVSLEALQDAMRQRFAGTAGELNATLAADGFALTTHDPEGKRHAQAG